MAISVRESIRWLPEAASEPTSTIVLTSPERRFVDIRILKDSSGTGSTEEDTPYPPLTSLDWAFAGTSSSETRNGVRHSTWRHFVDSRTREPKAVVDEGDVFSQDHERTLETGCMVNPATGKLTNYEEIWTDIEAKGDPEGARSLEDPSPLVKARCVVLELRRDDKDERGMVICLGRYCQGVVRVGDKFAAARSEWEKGHWVPKYRFGDIHIPTAEVVWPLELHPDGLKYSTITSDGLVWKVVEASEL
ncbi:hypothetical protein F5Y19DRAFT_121719 [Xylariaceae sp. FL1651]|nr:hypothetical protein F5Y19DRAFT_121719 [Xylariaceae sp. FL1651]